MRETPLHYKLSTLHQMLTITENDIQAYYNTASSAEQYAIDTHAQWAIEAEQSSENCKNFAHILLFALPITLAQSLPDSVIDSVCAIAPFIVIFITSAMFVCHFLTCATKTLDEAQDRYFARQKLLLSLPSMPMSQLRTLCKQHGLTYPRNAKKSLLFQLLSETL